MPEKPPTFRPAHLPSPQQTQRAYDQRRAERETWRGWYKLAAWLALRAQQLRKQPLCETCLQAKPMRYTAATVVHHKRPHRGVWALFIDAGNLASACKPCHDGQLQREERRAIRGGR